MIRMSKLADYAFILLTQMLSDPQKAWAAGDLAEKTTLPAPTVAKLMKMLAKGGVVVAQRGAGGGYRLARGADSINLADIIESVDGPIALTDCADVEKTTKKCAVRVFCPMCNGWDIVNKNVRAALSDVSLAVFVSGAFTTFPEKAAN
jgi:FeS assembly SUF system regulator